MGLPRKHHRVKMTWPEYLGIGLLAFFLIVVTVTYSELDQMNWRRTTARVIGVSVLHDDQTVHSPIGTSNNGVTVLYQYEAGLRTFTSTWTSNWLNTPVVNRAAPTLLNRATDLKVLDLDEVAKSAERMMYNSTRDRPAEITDPRLGGPEVSRTLRGEDYYGVLSERRKALGGVAPEVITSDDINRLLPDLDMSMLTGIPSGVESSSPVRATVSRFVAEQPQLIQKAMEINVRFDPANPANSALDYPGFNLHLPVLLLDVVLALLLIRYFTRTYPSLKLQGF